ncbi:MAG: RNA 2',3'-cyclic phosphodiesterase, partial [Candidatus Aenigmarchaeota archaeon]|nr:RNA 2',3'-cyclic phosphodiesterase [Candidatus Aenigmarchaeota archaeon]MDI6721990.1 RNA 2',3'-cyclic phosphodiesterase [Candidatus Aenigmarchaeota archaeon]
MMRCFIAVDIPDHLKLKITELQEQLVGYDIKLAEPENLHFTLKFLGEIDDPDKIAQRLGFLKNKNSFDIHLKGVGAFPSEKFIRVIWIGVENGEKIINLQKSIDDSLYPMFIVKQLNKQDIIQLLPIY